MKLIDMLVEDGMNGWRWPAGVKCITQDYGSGPIYRGMAFGYREEPHLKKNIWLANNGLGHADVTVKRYDAVADDWATAIITREQYEAALAAKNEGWIDWGGGEYPPVSTNAVVDVKLRCGSVTAGQPAGAMNWQVNAPGDPGDIIAYRLHKPQEAAQAEADDEADLNECIGQDAAPVWNGEGLPPVGCECEFISNDTSWGSVVVIGMDGDKVVIKPSGETYYGITPSGKQVFRPIRSEADRKRDEAVQALCNAGGGNGKVDEKADYGSCWFDVYDAIAAGKIPGVKLEV